MTLKLIINPSDPPTEVLIVTEILKSQNKENIIISWCKEWKGSGNVLLYGKDGKILAEQKNEINRYLARTLDETLYGGICPRERTEVDHWLSFAIGQLAHPLSKGDILEYLDRILLTQTWLANKTLTLADIHVFCVLLNNEFLNKFEDHYSNIARWYKHILSLTAVKNTLSLIANNKVSSRKNVQGGKTILEQTKPRKQEGKFIDLPGAVMGKVVVRFPPEASGYLHIGHAKAALLNQYYAETFQGQLIMRFDDTNPAKETVEFEEAILQDLKFLQIKPDRFTHTSDYFERIEMFCTMLIKDELAYVDDTPAHIMKEQRDQRLKSANRDNCVEKSYILWEEMRRGTEKGQQCCVRAKIDYQSPNGCMRDPTIYRCKLEKHPRTGNRYKIYPTYDFACPIVDSLENVTHTLRTTEYHDRDEQYYWILRSLQLRRPYIWEYSRLNMTHTVLSKRKLTWFVNEGLVDGWDDPRFPTVRGILRRGMTVEGLKQFIIAQGSSRSVVFMEWDKIWAFNKKVIDPIAVRYTALDSDKTIPVHVVDAKEEWLTVQNHPKDPSKGTKEVRVSRKILIEKDDAENLIEGQNTTFINWGNLMIEKIERKDGAVISVQARLNLQDKNYKSTLKITWLAAPLADLNVNVEKCNTVTCYAVYFDHILNVAVMGKDDDFKDFIAKNTRKEVKMLGEVELKRVKSREIIQLQRKGFFICDVPYAPVSSYSSREQPIILFHIPDGHVTASMNPTITKPILPKSQQTEIKSVDNINQKIIAQGDKVRRLKSENAEKSMIAAEVKILLALKTDYKNSTGKDWKPNSVPKTFIQPQIEDDKAKSLADEIVKKNNKIAELQKLISQESEELKSLKTEYKKTTGIDWNCDEPKIAILKKEPSLKESMKNADELSNDIEKQGNKIRQLKSTSTNKAVIANEVQILLALKADYRNIVGNEWKPMSKVNTENKTQDNATSDVVILSNKIQKQGDKVRQLKSNKADKSTIDQEVKVLLNLKANYKTITGQDWKPVQIAVSNVVNLKADDKEIQKGKEISDKIREQGNKVRSLKNSETDKNIIEREVKILLNLKNDYKSATGQDWQPTKSEPTPKKKQEDISGKRSEKEITKNIPSKDEDAIKTRTRLGLEVKKEENFFDWYSQIITKGGMIEYYDVSGCYILRPWSFAIWKILKEYIDNEITALGVHECYFPIFVTRSVLEKEKSHIADFAPEVAWVTKCGDSDMAEPLAIRPTSETVMYPAYAKWLKSDTELPLKLNQWNNVVRWEFKDPKPFLRTREFLWQEGHTAFATKAEADDEVMTILDMYARVYEEFLAVPVIKGRKTEKEKFAGGDYTTTVEAFISTSGRAIQGATSHHLGQNFSKMFNIQIEDAEKDDGKTFVFQNSWGLTTRTIGVMIMVHGDDKGLVLPPNVACIQAVIVPCGITANTTIEQRELLQSECIKLVDELKKDGKFKIKGDFRSNRTPGWKFNHWELKGVPVRIELGPKDLEKDQVTFVRRDNFQRLTAKRNEVTTQLASLLTDIQSSLFNKAKEDLKSHIKHVEDWNDFVVELNNKNLLLSPFCGESECEDNIKKDSARENNGEEPGQLSMGAKSLCIPFEQPLMPRPINQMKCIHQNCENRPKYYTLFGRCY